MTTKQFIKKLKLDYIKAFWDNWGVEMSGGEYGGYYAKMDYINELLRRLNEPEMRLEAKWNPVSATHELIDLNTSAVIDSRKSGLI